MAISIIACISQIVFNKDPGRVCCGGRNCLEHTELMVVSRTPQGWLQLVWWGCTGGTWLLSFRSWQSCAGILNKKRISSQLGQQPRAIMKRNELSSLANGSTSSQALSLIGPPWFGDCVLSLLCRLAPAALVQYHPSSFRLSSDQKWRTEKERSAFLSLPHTRSAAMLDGKVIIKGLQIFCWSPWCQHFILIPPTSAVHYGNVSLLHTIHSKLGTYVSQRGRAQRDPTIMVIFRWNSIANLWWYHLQRKTVKPPTIIFKNIWLLWAWEGVFNKCNIGGSRAYKNSS